MAKQNPYRIPLFSWMFSGILVISISLLGFFGLSYANFLKTDTLQTIKLYGQRTMSPDRIKELTDPYFGKPLHALDLLQIRDSFLEYPLIRSAKVARQFPNKLNIYLYDILPVAYISVGGRFLTLDEKRTLLPLPDKGMLYNLPIITGMNLNSSELSLGNPLEQESVEILVDYLKTLRQEHQSLYLDISEITYDKDGIRIISAQNGTTVYLGNEDEAQLHSQILAVFNSEESDDGTIGPYEYIDLRFNRQVIVKERK